MNLPGYDAWKLACPDDMTAEEEARLIAERDEAREQFRKAIEGTIADERGELYLSEVHDIVGEVLAKQKRHPSEPEHQVKMLNPIKADPTLLEALRKLVTDLDGLIADSTGVYGLHLNGDASPWGELLAGGRFEEWLASLEDARAAIAAATTKGE